jgi:hypothetical protein
MDRKSNQNTSELARGARTRARLPESMAESRLFQGWGPTVY